MEHAFQTLANSRKCPFWKAFLLYLIYTSYGKWSIILHFNSHYHILQHFSHSTPYIHHIWVVPCQVGPSLRHNYHRIPGKFYVSITLIISVIKRNLSVLSGLGLKLCLSEILFSAAAVLAPILANSGYTCPINMQFVSFLSEE